MANNKLKNKKSRQISDRALRRFHAILGLILITGGALSLYDPIVAVQDEDSAALLQMLCGEVQLLGGIWLLLGLYPEMTRPWTVAALIGIWTSSLYQVCTGKCSSGWFGSLSLKPWFVLMFALTALFLLLRWLPSGSRDAMVPTPLKTLGLGITALLIAIAGVSRQPLIVVSGTANLGGHSLNETPLVFRGNSVEVKVQTDHDGYFRLPPIRPGQYTVSMITSASPSDSASDSPDRSSPKTAMRERGKRTKSAAKPRQQLSEAALEYKNTNIIVLEFADCSTNSVVVDFK